MEESSPTLERYEFVDMLLAILSGREIFLVQILSCSNNDKKNFDINILRYIKVNLVN